MNKKQRLFFFRNPPVLSSFLLKIHLNKVVSEPGYFLLITLILSSPWLITMETRGKTNAEFRDEVNNILSRHESSLEQIHCSQGQLHATLQSVLSELQALRVTRNSSTSHTTEVNSFSSPGGASSSNSNTSTQHLKLNFPAFDGQDPQAWIYKAEQFFSFKNIPPDHQAQLASFHLGGIALQWYRWLTKFKGPLSWSDLTRAALLRFGPTNYDDPAKALTRLRQTTTVAAYQDSFEKLSHQIDGLPEGFLIGSFIAGLKDDIRLDVKIKHPKTLAEAIGVAWLIEERNLLQRRLSSSFRPTFAAITTRGNVAPAPGVLGPAPATRVANTTPTLRRLSNQKARDRREKGLCYYCDEKYTTGHRCERPQLFMIADPSDMPPKDDEINHLPETELELIPEISLHAIAGTDHPRTLRVIGMLQAHKVAVLIDGGNTHNFIDQTLAMKLSLKVSIQEKIQVVVANKEKIECAGLCKGLAIIIQGCPIVADFYVLPVATCPMVLGIQWLATLGPIETDYA